MDPVGRKSLEHGQSEDSHRVNEFVGFAPTLHCVGYLFVGSYHRFLIEEACVAGLAGDG
jgi:hypothetical protein